ncbi:probable maleylacetoacetate isomerase 1 [Hyposmocoma kahamanoa]|uniref:probable maleylacetoacetate isomerase 1 n=1 Tax=Hyposmocoma kahamanoa TaxID=1477025 RepID=UPI000E6DA4C0|nr:probable maleylacetoacetate isomerase 1 [Hyposmocoma kahamanoa]
MAILQYLEDTRPEPSLTPANLLQKTHMRAICETIVSGIQPLQNLGLRPRFDTEQQFQKFALYHTERGLQTLEELLKKTAGEFCVGDQLTMADLCFVPQLFNATTRTQLDISKYPTVSKLYEGLLKKEVFKETHPHVVKSKL